MNRVAKYSLTGVFAIAAVAGSLMQVFGNKSRPVIIENIICTVNGEKILNEDGTYSPYLLPKAKADLEKALALIPDGKITFAYGGAHVVVDDGGTNHHEALFIITGKGLVCYDNDASNCVGLSDLTVKQRTQLKNTLCERVRENGSKDDLIQKFCSLKP